MLLLLAIPYIVDVLRARQGKLLVGGKEDTAPSTRWIVGCGTAYGQLQQPLDKGPFWLHQLPSIHRTQIWCQTLSLDCTFCAESIRRCSWKHVSRLCMHDTDTPRQIFSHQGPDTALSYSKVNSRVIPMTQLPLCIAQVLFCSQPVAMNQSIRNKAKPIRFCSSCNSKKQYMVMFKHMLPVPYIIEQMAQEREQNPRLLSQLLV